MAQGPQMLPGGQHVLFTLATGTAPNRWDKAQIVVQSVCVGRTKDPYRRRQRCPLRPDGSPRVRPRRQPVRRRIRRAAAGGEGSPVPMVEGVRRAAGRGGAANFSISSTGSLIYIPGTSSIASGQAKIALTDRTEGR